MEAPPNEQEHAAPRPESSSSNYPLYRDSTFLPMERSTIIESGSRPVSRPTTAEVSSDAPRHLEHAGTLGLVDQATDGVVKVILSSQELSHGIKLDWSYQAPVIHGILPASEGEAHPQLVPGLALVSIAGQPIIQTNESKVREALMHTRPLELVFVSADGHGETCPSMTNFQIGEFYRTLQPVVLRQNEDLQSDIVAEADENAILEVLEWGIGASGRRLKVDAAGHVGWVSFMTKQGQLLLETMPCRSDLEIVPCQSDAEIPRGFLRRESEITEIMEYSSSLRSSRPASRDAKADAKARRRDLLLARKRHSFAERDPDDEPEHKRRTTRFSRYSKKSRSSGRSMTSQLSGRLPSRKTTEQRMSVLAEIMGWKKVQRIDSEENSDDDEYEDKHESEAKKAVLKRQKSRIDPREKALFRLDMVETLDGRWHTGEQLATIKGAQIVYEDGTIQKGERPYDTQFLLNIDGEVVSGKLMGVQIVWSNGDVWNRRGESWWRKFKRKSRLLDLQIIIELKRIQTEEDPPYFPTAHALASDLRFEVFIALLIIINVSCLGMETFYPPGDLPTHLNVAENLFTAIFLIEFFIRIMAFTWVWCFSFMNAFDIFLVWFTGVLVVWILPPLGVNLASLRRLSALRILRLARLCRTVRVMPMFKELWVLVQGVVSCTGLLFWTLVLGGLVHYVFAIAVIEFVAKDDQWRDDENVKYFFGSLAGSMFSLFQIMCFDGWAQMIRPITDKDVKATVLFFLFMGIAGIVLFNLMTAIVVRNAFDAAEADKEAKTRMIMEQKREIRNELLEMFKDLDEDGSGYLSLQEFTECLDDVTFVQKMKLLDIDLEDLPDIYAILDDGDGQVDQDEFCEGMMAMQGPAMSCEMMRATCGMRQQNIHFEDLEKSFVELSLATYRQVSTHVDQIHENMHDLIHLSAEVVTKLNHVGLRKVVRGTARTLPTLLDPELDELVKIEKQRKKDLELKEEEEQRRLEEGLPPQENSRLSMKRASTASRNSVASQRDEMLPESFVSEIIPPSWIVRNERTPLMQNPGKLKLLLHPELEHKIIMSKPKTKAKNVITGARRDFGKAWQDLNLPLSEVGTLEGPELDDEPLTEPQPIFVSQLPNGCVGGQKPVVSSKSNPLAALGLPMAQPSSTKVSTVAGGKLEDLEESNKASKKVASSVSIDGPSLPGAVVDK